MSLIQDALKRKENEENGGSPAGSGSAAADGVKLNLAPPADNRGAATVPVAQNAPEQSMPVPPNIPKVQAPAARHPRSFLWFIVAAIAAGTGIAIVLGFILLSNRPRPGKPDVAPPIVQNGATGTAAAIIAPADNMTTAVNYSGVATAAPSQLLPAPAGTATSVVAVPVGPGQGGTNPTPSQIAGKEEVKTSFKKPLARKRPVAASPTVKWPALKLTGILRGVGTEESTALINGKMIRIGQEVEGVKLVEIQSDGIILKYGSENKFLRIGATLY